MSDPFDLTRRRVLGGLATIGAASAAAGAGTMAYFSDQETSDGNTVQAGTLDLTPEDPAAFVVDTNLAPGESVSGSVTLTNSGSLSADHLEIDTSISENDGSEPADPDLKANVTAQQFARNLFVRRLEYPAGDFFRAATQVPGAFVYDVDQDDQKTADVVAASDPAVGGRSGVVHATSGGSPTKDYTRSIVDVSAAGFTLNDVAGGDFRYDYYPRTANEVNAPDEVKLIVEDGEGIHFLFQHLTAGTAGQWNTRDLVANGELATGGNPGNGWYEVDLGGGSHISLGDSPLEEYGEAALLGVGFGAGNFSGNARIIDIYYDDLELSDGSTSVLYDFRSNPMSALDLQRTTIDNLASPGSGGQDFGIELVLNPQVGNAFQGDGVEISFTFTLNQDVSQ